MILHSLFIIPASVYAASSPWTQTDWSGGVGASTTNQYSAASSTDGTTTSGQVTLTNTEKFSNTGFESNLTGWNTGAQPDSISGLQLWLKADAITGLSDGGAISSWADSSGNGYNATQSTSANQPTYKTSILNSQPVVRFNGSAHFLTLGNPFNITNNVTTLVVFATAANTTRQTILGQRNTTSAVELEINGTGTPPSRGTIIPGTFTGYGAVTSSANTFEIFTYARAGAGATHSVYQNGTSVTLAVNTTNDYSANNTKDIGTRAGGQLLNGDIAEFIVYDSALSTTNRQSVEAYLQGKYAVSSGQTTLTRDTTTTYNSSAGSAKLVTGSSVGNFTQTINVGDTNTYNLVAYARTDGSAVTSSDVELFYNDSTISTTYTSVGSGWYKLTGTLTGANASRVYGVQVKANKTVYVDNMSLNNYASSGTLTSSIFDTEFSAGAAWGTLTYTSSGSTVTVKARTSNDSGMSGATDFTSCNSVTSGSDISSNNCVTDTQRYIQYQLSLANSSVEVTPTFSDISIAFENYDPNAPSISLTALTPDPNSDNTPTLSGTATDSIGTVSNVQFQMDSTSGSWSSCTATDESFNSASEAFSCTAATLTDGSHTMYVRATDSNGNTTSSSYASDTFTIDATNPVSIDLDSPGDNSYTNSERPTYKWKGTTDATAGLSKYVLEIDNPSAGSGQASGDFTIDNIPTSGTTDITSNNKYVIHFDGFSDSDTTNNYISVYTRSTNDWGSSENDGKLREGRVSWKVKAVDNAGNEGSSSRTLFVDRTNPNVEFTQINSSPFSTSSNSNFSTTDKTPTIFGKIIDPLSGGDSGQSQNDDGPRVASGPKEVNIKIEKKNGLTYSLVTLYKINMDNPYYTCEPGKTIDNSKQKCDKYLPFEYTPKENLDFGTYKITLTGKDKADNSSSEVTLTLNITTLAQITTPAEKKIIEEEEEQIKQELEITKPTEEVPTSALEKATSVIPDLIGNLYKSGTAWIPTFVGMTSEVVGMTRDGIAFTFNSIGNGIAFVFDKTGQGLAFTSSVIASANEAISNTIKIAASAIGNGLLAMTNAIGSTYNNIAQHAPGVTKNILLAIGNGVSTVGTGIGNGFSAIGTTTNNIANATGDFIGTTANNISTGISNTGSAIATTLNNTKNATGNGIANIAFAIGVKTEDVSHGLGTAIIKIGYLFVPEPTKISDVKVMVLSPTSAKISWKTNHPANGKVNYGLDETYPFDVQTEKRTNDHEFTLTNLKSDTEYYFEVMSQNRNYVYDANRKFKTPAKQ